LNKGGLIGIVVVLAVVLSGVIIRQHSQLSAATQTESAEKARNAELQKKVESLEQEVATLKETADYYFQNGVNLQAAGNFQEAKTAFEAVVAKFPTSSLVDSARQRLTAVNEAIAKAEADRLAEAQRQQEEQERQAQEQGEPIDFASFYAKMQTNGLKPGKHYRFEGTFKENLDLVCPANGEWAYCLKSMPGAEVTVSKETL
jgi:tetratricopeptide (TPR) repeat protein